MEQKKDDQNLPAKKLVQACLPFKPLNSSCIVPSFGSYATKKRKLIDLNVHCGKSMKTDEIINEHFKPIVLSSDENKVSSIDETCVAKEFEPLLTRSIWQDTMDDFVPVSQQLDVTPACQDAGIDLTFGNRDNLMEETYENVSSYTSYVVNNSTEDCGLLEYGSMSDKRDVFCSFHNDLEGCSIIKGAVTSAPLAMVSEQCTVGSSSDAITPGSHRFENDHSDFKNRIENYATAAHRLTLDVGKRNINSPYGCDAEGTINNYAVLQSEAESEEAHCIKSKEVVGNVLEVQDASTIWSEVDAKFQDMTALTCVANVFQETLSHGGKISDCSIDLRATTVQPSHSDAESNCSIVSERSSEMNSVSPEILPTNYSLLSDGMLVSDQQPSDGKVLMHDYAFVENQEKREKNRLELKRCKEHRRQKMEKERCERKLLKENQRLQKIKLIQQERRRKEGAKLDERKRKEDEKEKQVVKEKKLMERFFKTMKEDQKSQDIKAGPFMEFEVKENMRVAPRLRVATITNSVAGRLLDEHLIRQDALVLYLEELKGNRIIPRTSKPTWSREEAMVSVHSTSVDSACIMHTKLLQFHENYRPAYYGTWHKLSHIISARNPMRRDTAVFDYDADSDEEWEEEEPGESLSHSEGDDDDEEEDEEEDCGADEEADGFFVPHGYLSDGEGCYDDDDDDDDDDYDISPEKQKHQWLATANVWEADVYNKKSNLLQAVVVGIHWWDFDAVHCTSLLNKLLEYKGIFLDVPPFTTSYSSSVMSDSTDRTTRSDNKTKPAFYRPVPENAMPDLVRLVHGNEWSIKKLVHEFSEFWLRKMVANAHDSEDINKKYMLSKSQLKTKIKEIAVYELRVQCSKRKQWYVNSDLLQKLNLCNLPIPTQWTWITALHLKNLAKKMSFCSGISEALENKQPSHSDMKSFMTNKISSERKEEVVDQEQVGKQPSCSRSLSISAIAVCTSNVTDNACSDSTYSTAFFCSGNPVVAVQTAPCVSYLLDKAPILNNDGDDVMIVE